MAPADNTAASSEESVSLRLDIGLERVPDNLALRRRSGSFGHMCAPPFFGPIRRPVEGDPVPGQRLNNFTRTRRTEPGVFFEARHDQFLEHWRDIDLRPS